jgi:hypothetical protein
VPIGDSLAGPSPKQKRPTRRPRTRYAALPEPASAFLLVRGGRPARGWRSCDRGCPMGTGIDPSMWHANGTTGEERLGAGGELEALRPPARSPLFAGASNRHHLPTVGRPTLLFLPGRIAEPVLAPGALADSMPEVKKTARFRWRVDRRGPGGLRRLVASGRVGGQPMPCRVVVSCRGHRPPSPSALRCLSERSATDPPDLRRASSRSAGHHMARLPLSLRRPGNFKVHRGGGWRVG